MDDDVIGDRDVYMVGIFVCYCKMFVEKIKFYLGMYVIVVLIFFY